MGKTVWSAKSGPKQAASLCPDFLIETYLDHAGEKFCLEHDANSLLYVFKAMDLLILVKSTRWKWRYSVNKKSGKYPPDN